MNFFNRLVDKNNMSADSIIFFGLLSVVVLCGLQIYVTIRDPANFNPINFGGSVMTILGGIGGGKFLRDGWKKDETHDATPGEVHDEVHTNPQG